MTEAIGTDRRGRRLPPAHVRKERSRLAGEASRSISAYVRRIVRDAPQLTEQDKLLLRRVVSPVAAEAYEQGLRDGARLAATQIMEMIEKRRPLLREVTNGGGG